jgi:hypothetical protein
MNDLEAMLGKEPRRFDDWVTNGDYFSRLTVVRPDGVPETYEGRASDHWTARRQACELAVSAVRSAASIPFAPQRGFASPSMSPTMPPPPWGFEQPPPMLVGMGGGASGGGLVSLEGMPPPPPQMMMPPYIGMAFTHGLTPYMPAHMAPPLGMHAHQHPHGLKSPQNHHSLRQTAPAAGRGGGVGRPRFTGDCQTGGNGFANQRQHAVNPWYQSPPDSPRHARRDMAQRDDGCGKRSLHARPGGDGADDYAPALKKRGVNPADAPAASCKAALEAKCKAVKHENSSREVAAETGDEDDEEESDNHLTNFNELCQRGVAGLRVPKYNYVHLSSTGKVPTWECTATTAATPPEGGAPVTISTFVVGKNKKDARRIAAKELLAELVKLKIMTQETVDTKGANVLDAARSQGTEDESAENSATKLSPQLTADIAAAVSILNQLWQKEMFLCKPKWSNVPVSSGATGRWKCTLLVKTKQVGDVEVESILSQKKHARQMAAYEAVKKLRELNFRGIEQINVHAKPQNNIVSVAPTDDGDEDHESPCGVRDDIDEETRQRLDNEVENDGEVDLPASGDGAISGFGTEFLVPPEISVVVAKSSEDCSEWIAGHVTDGTILGVYLDSRSVRETFMPDASQSSLAVSFVAFTSEDCRVIALSTGKAALLVSAHLLGDARPPLCREETVASQSGIVSQVDEEAPSIAGSGPASLSTSEIAQSAGHDTARSAGESWIPKSLQFVLERKECAKYGIGLDEGVLTLRACHGVKCRGFHDLSILSLALKGVSGNKSSILASSSDLVLEWLNQRLSPFSEFSVMSIDGLSDIISSTADVVAPAIAVAVASSIIQSRVQETAEARRRKSFTDREDYMDLCNRLWVPPTAPPAPFKQYLCSRKAIHKFAT